MIDALFLTEAAAELRRYKDLADNAFAQVGDENFFRQIDPESNSIAVIVKHLAGNMRSRMTDFLASDGEKPDRDRDGEFVMEKPDDRAALMAKWNEGWRLTFSAIGALAPSDLGKEAMVQGAPQPVVRAINRHIIHIAYHVGQIAYLAKHFAGAQWQTLTVPRNRARRSTK